MTAALPALPQAEARLTCPMTLDISEHCASGGRAVLLLNAAVLFRRAGHYMTVVRGHGQQQGGWLAYNDGLSYWGVRCTGVEGHDGGTAGLHGAVRAGGPRHVQVCACW